jgi:integrase
LLLGTFGSQKSRERYQRVLATLEQHGGRYPEAQDGQPAGDLTVAEVVLDYWRHAENYYRLVDGSPSGELSNLKDTFKALVRLQGDLPALSYGPRALSTFRDHLINGTWLTSEEIQERKAKNRPTRLCRRVINQRVNHVKRLFRWAVSQELVRAEAYQGLLTIGDLRKGYAGTFDYAKVPPVTEDQVAKTLPFLPPQVAAMVQLQTLMGARPTEVCLMRWRAITDRDKGVWWYRIDPNEIEPELKAAARRANLHKTAHRETSDGASSVKLLPIGPRAQALLTPWLRDNPDEFLFQPREALVAMRKKKGGKAAKGGNRAKASPKRSPREHYDRHSYAQAVRRAAQMARVKLWHPHQLKHSCGTTVRGQFGVESSQVYLGHNKMATTEIYAEKNMRQVAEIALKVG